LIAGDRFAVASISQILQIMTSRLQNARQQSR